MRKNSENVLRGRRLQRCNLFYTDKVGTRPDPVIGVAARFAMFWNKHFNISDIA